MEVINSIFDYFLSASIFLKVLIVFGTLLFVHYVYRYQWRGWTRIGKIKKLVEKLGQLSDVSIAERKDTLNQIFGEKEFKNAFKNIWKEYSDTLHEQYQVKDGERIVTGVRATAPANAFFNLETLVDPVIATEYFRHLPGILTGMGIIGTFSGLIHGLRGFHPEVANEATLKAGLGSLFTDVLHAFTFSAGAIFAAMLVTWFEKLLYAKAAKQVTHLTAVLDGLFKSGVGEEYLAKLVSSSEQSATQTTQLKESLVGDLKTMLDEITNRQIQAQQEATQHLAKEVGAQIKESLHEPLNKISDTVSQASGEQTSQASATIETLMKAFIEQLEGTLGAQMRSMAELMQNSAQSMRQVETSLRTLLAEMGETNKTATVEMSRTMQDLMTAMRAQQQSQTEQQGTAIAELLTQIKNSSQDMVTQQQSLNQHLQKSLSSMLDKMGANMDASMTAMNEQQQSQAEQQSTAIAELLTQIKNSSQDMVTQQQNLNQHLQESLSSVLDKMCANMDASMTAMNEQQQSQAEQQSTAIAELLTQIKNSSQDMVTQQQNLNQHLQESLSSMLDKMGANMDASMTAMNEQQQSQAEQQESLNQHLQDSLSSMLDKMNGHVRELTQSQHQHQQHTEDLLRSLSEKYSDATSRFEQSAMAIDQVLDRITEAMTQMGGLAAGLGASSQHIAASSEQLSSGTQQLNKAIHTLTDTTKHWESLGQLVQEETTRRRDMLNDLKALTEQTHTTGEILTKLSREVKDHLQTKLNEFGHGMTKVLSENLNKYNKQLERSVSILSDGLVELSDKFAELADALDLMNRKRMRP